jgi:hypothetical protein
MRISTVLREHYNIIRRMHTPSLKTAWNAINRDEIDKRFGELSYDESIEVMKQLAEEMGERIFSGRAKL